MQLLIEQIDNNNIKFIPEDQEYVDVDGSKKNKKVYKVKGIFLGAESKNRNGRVYPKYLLEREVKRYNTDLIDKNGSVGTLDHGATPNIDLDRISHMIERLEMNGNEGYGEARIFNHTPCGLIAIGLIQEGVQLGMSTRGVGSLDGDTVGEDFNMLSIDLVNTPSYQKAYVESFVESKNWERIGNTFVEVAVQNLKNKVHNKYNSDLLLQYMSEFAKEITRKI